MTTDLLLLDVVLQSLERIILRFLDPSSYQSTSMTYEPLNEQQCHELKDALDLLTAHPLDTISHAALRVQVLVDRLNLEET